jgi:hypothetical protein
MSLVPISRSPDLQRLRDEGYAIRVRNSHLVMDDVPYVNAAAVVQYGTLVSTLELNNDQTIRPTQHVAHFAGEHPCDRNGKELVRIKHSSQRQTLAAGITVDHSFSSKPDDGYVDYYHKMTTYANILAGPAQAIDATHSNHGSSRSRELPSAPQMSGAGRCAPARRPCFSRSEITCLSNAKSLVAKGLCLRRYRR